MSGLTLAQGRLFGAIFESMLYGINFILFASFLYLRLKHKTTRRRSHRIRIAVVSCVFVLCTAHQAAIMRELYVAFFLADIPPDAFYLDHTQPTDLIQKAIYAAVTFFADGILIFRAYTIFNGSWLAVAVPLASLFATIGLWAALIRAYRVSAPGTVLFPPAVARLVVASYAMSFLTNVIITGMIGVRIWLVLRRFRGTGISTSFYKRFLAYSVETGVVYPTALLLNGVFFFLNNNALEVLSGSVAQVLGIVPILLALQLHFNLSPYDNATAGTQVHTGPLQIVPGARSGVSQYDVELHEGSGGSTLPSELTKDSNVD